MGTEKDDAAKSARKTFEELSLYYFNEEVKPLIVHRFEWVNQLPRAIKEQMFSVMLIMFRVGLTESVKFESWAHKRLALFTGPSGPP